MRRHSPKLFLLTSLLSLLAVSGCSKKEPDPRAKDIEARLARLEQVPMKFDARDFPQQQKELLKALVEAGQLVHEAYLYQVCPEGIAIRDSLAVLDDELSKNMLRLVERNGGIYDKIDGFTNFFNGTTKLPGAGFYPADLSKDELEGYLALRPHETTMMLSPFTIVKRDNGQLKAAWFHEEYTKYLVAASELLKKASTLTQNQQFKKFLETRAGALLTDDYYQSHLDWLEVTDSDVDLLMAPDEVYDDALMGMKASYEVSVMLKDSAESAKLDVFVKYLSTLEQNLPIEKKYKRSVAKLSSPMEIVTDIYRGGDIATGYLAVAATLPNDPKVQTTKGTKKIFWKNVMVARVDNVIVPIGRELIASDQIEYITTPGVFSDVVMHELCHSIGPRFVYGTHDSLSVNQALKDRYSALEEAKADIAGLHSMRYFVEKGIVPKEMEKIHAVSALASIFRTIRFGTSEAHGKACISELNYFLQHDAVRFDPNTKKWSVIFEKFGPAVTALAKELLMLEATGDYAGAEKFFTKWSYAPKEVEESLKRLAHLPVDIEPIYTVKWE